LAPCGPSVAAGSLADRLTRRASQRRAREAMRFVARRACLLAARPCGAAALVARPPPRRGPRLVTSGASADRRGAAAAPAGQQRAGAGAKAAAADLVPAVPTAQSVLDWASGAGQVAGSGRPPQPPQEQPQEPEQESRLQQALKAPPEEDQAEPEHPPQRGPQRAAYSQSPQSQRPTLEALAVSRQPVVVATFYKFAELLDHESLREALEKQCAELSILGTLLLAREGINGTVAGPRASVTKLLERLRADPRLSDLAAKESLSTVPPFVRLKVKVKPEIVTMGVLGVDPTRQRGTYVAPRDWNALIASPDVLLVDTRRTLEVKVGAFEGALDPGTNSFREFPRMVERLLEGKPKDTKVAMYCTGGIRCEKSTSLLRLRGFTNLFHLEGGILKYLDEVPRNESKFRGECYVFDERVAVDHDLRKGTFEECRGCLSPLTEHDRASPDFKLGVHCPHCVATLPESRRLRMEARQRQIDLAAQRGERHIGQVYEPISKREARRRAAVAREAGGAAPRGAARSY
jgi:UPF0176 protein